MFGSFRARDIFQSTQPSQAVTRKGTVRVMVMNISIHTALAGCDLITHPYPGLFPISIHTALAGCDGDTTNIDTLEFISIHTALAGCDMWWVIIAN